MYADTSLSTDLRSLLADGYSVLYAATVLGVHPSTVYNRAKKLDLSVKGKRRPYLNLQNRQFSDWQVVSAVPQTEVDQNRQSPRSWRCRCKCGVVETVSEFRLVSGKITRCENCAGERQTLPLYFFNKLKKNAAHREIAFSITYVEMAALYEKQNGSCALTGHSLCFSGNARAPKTTASPDRIDSDRGYIKGNVQWVHKDVNKMKGSLPNDEFVGLCTMVTQRRSQ